MTWCSAYSESFSCYLIESRFDRTKSIFENCTPISFNPFYKKWLWYILGFRVGFRTGYFCLVRVSEWTGWEDVVVSSARMIALRVPLRFCVRMNLPVFTTLHMDHASHLMRFRTLRLCTYNTAYVTNCISPFRAFISTVVMFTVNILWIIAQ